MSRWFRNTASGQVFEAEGEQANIAARDRDTVELKGPPEHSDEAHPELAGLRERLDSLGVPWSENATPDELRTLLDTQVTAWRGQLAAKGVTATASWKPETLKKKLDELKE